MTSWTIVLSIQWCDHTITQRYFSEQHSQTPYPWHLPVIYGFWLCEHLHSDLKGKKSYTVSWGGMNCLRLKKQNHTQPRVSLFWNAPFSTPSPAAPAVSQHTYRTTCSYSSTTKISSQQTSLSKLKSPINHTWSLAHFQLLDLVVLLATRLSQANIPWSHPQENTQNSQGWLGLCFGFF